MIKLKVEKEKIVEGKQVIIYTDGSSRGNPGPGGYAFVVVYPNATAEMRIDEAGGREVMTTNNRMEMKAVIEALHFFNDYYAKGVEVLYEVRLDSSYVMQGATKWIHGWKAKNWITASKEDVKNVDLWQDMDEVMKGKKIEWTLLKGHNNIFGNEKCDQIATTYADGKVPELYKGFLSEYPDAEAILNVEPELSGSEKKAKKSSSKNKNVTAYSYVSKVGGIIHVDKNWDDCKNRVHKSKGALYKKSISPMDESEIISEFKNK
ncbi:MAG: ribonuclease H [bacterium]